MTLLELQTVAEAQGLPTEFISQLWPISSMLGIKNGKHVWHWFTEFTSKDKTHISFDHSYSQNTGKSLRSTGQSIYVKTSIGKKLKIDLYS